MMFPLSPSTREVLPDCSVTLLITGGGRQAGREGRGRERKGREKRREKWREKWREKRREEREEKGREEKGWGDIMYQKEVQRTCIILRCLIFYSTTLIIQEYNYTYIIRVNITWSSN